VEQSEPLQQVHRDVDWLSLVQAEAFLLKYPQGWPYDVMAGVSGTSVGALRPRFHVLRIKFE
jgi:DNA-directed RNA polymerase specialized sigma24 family protein